MSDWGKEVDLPIQLWPFSIVLHNFSKTSGGVREDVKRIRRLFLSPWKLMCFPPYSLKEIKEERAEKGFQILEGDCTHGLFPLLPCYSPLAFETFDCLCVMPNNILSCILHVSTKFTLPVTKLQDPVFFIFNFYSTYRSLIMLDTLVFYIFWNVMKFDISFL